MTGLALIAGLAVLLASVQVLAQEPPKDQQQDQNSEQQRDKQKEEFEKFEETHKEAIEKSEFFSKLSKGGLLDKVELNDGPPPMLRFETTVDGKPAKMMLILGVPPQPEQLILLDDGGGSSPIAPMGPGEDHASGISRAVRAARSASAHTVDQPLGDVSGAPTGETQEKAMGRAQGMATALKAWPGDDESLPDGPGPGEDAARTSGTGTALDAGPGAHALSPDLSIQTSRTSPAAGKGTETAPPEGSKKSVSMFPDVLKSVVPALGGPGEKPGWLKSVSRNAGKLEESFWAAAGKLAPAAAADRLRGLKQGASADSQAAWLGGKREEMISRAEKITDPAQKARLLKTVAGIDSLLKRKLSAEALGDRSRRTEALGEWGAAVSKLMDDSSEAGAERSLLDRRAALEAAYGALNTGAERQAWLKAHGAEYEAAGKDLAGLYAANPLYLAARKAEADARLFMRSSLRQFRDGTSFTSGELGFGLPAGTRISIARSPEGSASGARGLSYKDPGGLAHFQSFDDRVRVDEVMAGDAGKLTVERRLGDDGTLNTSERRADGALLRTEERRPDGTVVSEAYAKGGAPAFSVLRRPDGSSVQVEMLAGGALKQTVSKDASGNGTFTLEGVSTEGGYPRRSGRVAGGRLITDRVETGPGQVTERAGEYLFEKKKDGRSTGMYEVDMAAITALPEAQRPEAARQAAYTMTGGKTANAGPLSQFIARVSEQAGGDPVSLSTAKDTSGNTLYHAEILGEGGYRRQVLGQWTKLSRAERAGLASDVGLDVSVRSGGPADDFSRMQYLKLFRYSGQNITDRYTSSSRVTGNWFVGYGVREDNYVHRYVSGSDRELKKIYVGHQSLYSSPSILGQTGIALGKMGKGTVQLTASAMAVAGAGTIGWADRNLQDEFLMRAKSNFFGNEVSRDLGRNYLGSYYAEGYERLNVDEDRNIQSVGREMANMGQPTLGAVLQGGVEFSNQVATSLIMAPVGGSTLSKGLEKMGTAGTVVGKTLAAGKSVKYAYQTGAAGTEFVSAYRAFDENDPASRQRYYSAVTGLTTQALWSPATASGLMKTAANARQLKDTLTAKPSPILGADGRPYQAPPVEMGSFQKFMLGKTGPGVITKTMTSDISGGLDPALRFNFSDNPAARAIGRLDNWMAAQADRIAGRPVAMPRPSLIIPGQTQPAAGRPGLIIPGQEQNGRPPAALIIPGQTQPAAGRPGLIIPGQEQSGRPPAAIIIP